MRIHFWHSWIFPEPWPAGALKLPSYQAHRGYHVSPLIENTLAAFQAAKKQGIKMCECDVQLSRDGVPVVFHDPSLKRLFSSNEMVVDLTSKELFKKAQVQTLESLLLDENSPELWNLEIKSPKMIDPLFAAIARVIINTKSEQRVMVSSFNPMALIYFSVYFPQIPRALLVTEERHAVNKFYLREMLLAPFLKIHMLNLEQKMLDVEALSFWRSQKMPLSVWTLRDKVRAEAFLAQGVVSVIADPEGIAY